MTITLMTASGRTQITHLVSGLTWSGNKSTASRMLAFSLLVSAPGLNLSVRNGDHVTMDDAGVCRFAGMVVRVPDYFEEFRCLAGACPHTCCAKWEVVIDEATAQRYEKVPGALGEKLRSALDRKRVR